ncbi:MAG: isoprenylcysteine carboxylmethyltransferase family protein [Ignavibacteriales bacterium]|nr:isoprenylcysteine carboxylmethyltransferase family protein [Ignavibacteriales bacterium]
MTVSTILGYTVILFPISEIALLIFKRTKRSSSDIGDKGSLRLLWFAIIVSIGVAVTLQWQPMTVFQISRSLVDVVALCLLSGGFIVRWISIITLGRMFTVNVAIQEKHHLVQSGMYKYVRHPSYTGMLIEFLGLSVYFGTWICLAVVMVPITIALLYRIHCEEMVLAKEFGKQFEEYKAHTKAILPGIV